jgi:hypothetical protein
MAEPSFEDICKRLEIPENLRKHVASTTPPRAKMAVARGLLPVPPKTLLAMQYMLLGDAAADVASETEKALLKMPEDRLVPLLDRKTHPKLLEFLAYRRPDHQSLAEAVALSHQINDKTLCYLAESGTSRVCEIVAGNQERLIITPQVRLFLERNSNASKALIDRVRSFQRLYGIELSELSEALDDGEQSATTAPSPTDSVAEAPPQAPPIVTEKAPGAVWSIPLKGAEPAPSEATETDGDQDAWIPTVPGSTTPAPAGLLNPVAALLADWNITLEPSYLEPPEGSAPSDVAGRPLLPRGGQLKPPMVLALDLAGAEELTGQIQQGVSPGLDISGSRSLVGTDFTFNFDEEEATFDDEFVDPNVEDEDAVRLSLQRRLTTMSMADKIKLAYKGNKSARDILVRDPNKIIGVAVVKSGRITETEVMAIAMNRSINEEVIRALTENREYLRKYPVKLALANNPKTPIPTAMGLLNSLHVNDLKKLAKNRNVGSAVFMQANKLYRARKAGQ